VLDAGDFTAAFAHLVGFLTDAAPAKTGKDLQSDLMAGRAGVAQIGMLGQQVGLAKHQMAVVCDVLPALTLASFTKNQGATNAPLGIGLTARAFFNRLGALQAGKSLFAELHATATRAEAGSISIALQAVLYTRRAAPQFGSVYCVEAGFAQTTPLAGHAPGRMV
jgi:hypothetical protein